MSVGELLEDVREAVPERVWAAAVRLAREGAVEGVGRDDDEVRLRVKVRGRPTPHVVHLWPDEVDAGCDCDLSQPCVHIAAAVIALNKGLKLGDALPEAAPSYRVALRYDFRRAARKLEVSRVVVWPDGREAPLSGTLADSRLMASRADTQAETLLALHSGGPLDEEKLRRLLVILEGRAPATLDGRPVKLSDTPVAFVVRVRDEDERFRVGLYRPPGLDDLFLGAALKGGTLHPTTYGELTPTERRALHPRRDERVFDKDQVTWLVSDYLPRLRGLGLPVIVETDRLPDTSALQPRIQLHLSTDVEGLRVKPVLVYGDPPVARVEAGKFVKLGDVVPARDVAAERRVARTFEGDTKLAVGFARSLPPVEAAGFLQTVVPRLDVEVLGRVDEERFRVVDAPVAPVIDVTESAAPTPGFDAPAAADLARSGFKLDVRFEGDRGAADPEAVLRAWRSGRSLVPLLDGGYAPLPLDWLREHGALLAELLEARDEEGRVHRNATAALVELLEDTDVHVPPDLRKLRSFLEAGEGLPEAALPDGFSAELRPYQSVGYRWLRFLREMDLHGVLADDMGLGKTVQALTVLADTPGPHLVVAPTSVLRNWQREAGRFAPRLKVCLFHGPDRVLDPDADLVLTSYALLRMDLDRLRAMPWSWAVLDEAQAIKNPRSQTARSACALQARHRLALSGTPVENRLEELWSIFRFLMPGLLGPLQTFKERFVLPVEAGDRSAAEALRQRVRPYVLRRLKRQVASDLPPLTEITVRCEMGAEQRRVYEAVRQSARREVLDAMSERTGRGYHLQILEALLRMRQACCDPTLLPGDTGVGVGSAKLDKLEEVLVELFSEGHKTLVFSQWTSMLDRVEPRLRELGVDWVRLDGGTRDRQKVIDAFQDPDGPPVFLLSLKAGGTGLNLTAADYVIHLDPWWNPAVQQQATDRAHRIGQDKPVVSVRLIAESTVEERILELQEAKRELADAALGGDGALLRALDADELRALFDAA